MKNEVLQRNQTAIRNAEGLRGGISRSGGRGTPRGLSPPGLKFLHHEHGQVRPTYRRQAAAASGNGEASGSHERARGNSLRARGRRWWSTTRRGRVSLWASR